MLAIVNKVAPYIDRGLPGGWNDLDMLEVGLGGMTDEEVVFADVRMDENVKTDASAVQSALLDVGRPEIATSSGQ